MPYNGSMYALASQLIGLPILSLQNAETITRVTGLIMEIKSLEVGINVLKAPTSYDLVLIVEFANILDLQAYQAHPEHVKVADYILKIREARAVVDYEY